MNRTFDYNGVQIAPSKPVQKLRTVKKTLHIDSVDRDVLQYPRNGDFTVYLPRVYEKVVSLSVTAAEFPITAVYTVNKWDLGTQTGAAVSADPTYFFMEIEGLNKCDETAPSANRSSSTDSVFAKFQVANVIDRVQYNENSGVRLVQYYQPAISKLDRLRIRFRTHTMLQSQYMYWPDNELSLTLEIETLENSFDDFSVLESRIGDRAGSGFFGC